MAVSAAAAVLLGVLLAGDFGDEAETETTAEPSASVTSPPTRPAEQTTKKARASRPVLSGEGTGRLVIDSLGVDAPVVPIAAPDGVLWPPKDPQTLGWWRDGAQPGERTGSALITGHTVSSGGGALDDLEELSAGDRLSVTGPRGRVTYEVREVEIYSKGSLAREAERLFSQSVPGRLVVITCEDWNGEIYLSNVVVTATPA